MCTAPRTIAAIATAMPSGCRIVRARDFWRICGLNERAWRKVPGLIGSKAQSSLCASELALPPHRVERIARGRLLRDALRHLHGKDRHLLLQALESELA